MLNFILLLSSTKAWVEAGRLNQILKFGSTDQLNLTRHAFLHDFGTAEIQTTCVCHVEQNS